MTNDPDRQRPTLPRRRLLYLAGAGTAGLALAACGGDDGGSGGSPEAAGASTTHEGDSGAASPDCVLTPEEIEGPFYTDVNLLRRDITDGREGSPLEIGLTVVDAATCEPIPDASVDIWHADAAGLYSAFTGQGDSEDIDTSGESFLRGVQSTDASGGATFDTIYPGWYQGRTTHLHLKIHFDDQTRVTTQLYFPDDVTATVYDQQPYADRGQKDTANDEDGFGADDASLRMTVTASGEAATATHTLGISRG